VILVDANVLLYAKISDYPQHRAAGGWLDGRLNGPARVGLPWTSLLAFLRISTNPRLFERPLGISAAWQQVEEWLAVPQVWIPLPTDRHAEVLGELVRGSSPAGPLVSDADLAALAIEHGLVLCSTDGDFARFPGLRWENPLADTN
jgi:toxin-antitoxin system PIN domain toxin